MKIYSTGCPQCVILETFLKDKKVDYEKCDDEDTIIKSGITSIPTLEVDGTHYNFLDALNYVKGL